MRQEEKRAGSQRRKGKSVRWIVRGAGGLCAELLSCSRLCSPLSGQGAGPWARLEGPTRGSGCEDRGPISPS
eukprot:6596908-Prymnesium_polylepis.1